MSAVIGVLISIGFIILSVITGGDSITSLLSAGSAMIVLGGTFGSIITQYGPKAMLQAVKAIITLVKPPPSNIALFINQVADWSNLARSQGSLSLESVLGSTTDAFQKKGLQMIIDNTSQDDLRSIFGILSDNAYRQDMIGADVWEAAGGYTPTIGVLGAVLGLIAVMQRLDHPAELGPGIATAFTATIYGVGAANLVFLPLGARIASAAAARNRDRQIVVQGFVLLSEGKSGTLIRQNLQSFLTESKPKAADAGSEGKLGEAAGQAA
ncbi:MotA/TolQ/ExbB proton channel family protein [Acidisoma sp.]|uniref:MotA/TolQ/ExbB proton channel family protein n=1 Tax=Acidisoma sp. TaxID=1872115 RepID=UPI003B0064E9